MKVTGLAHFALEVSDLERSVKFYIDAFRTRELKRLGFSEEDIKKGRTRHVNIEIGNAVVTLFESRERHKLEPRGFLLDNPRDWSPYRHFAFTVPAEEFDQWVTHLREVAPRYGQTVFGPKAHGGGSRGLSIYFDDPDGYHLELNAHYPTQETFQWAHGQYGRIYGVGGAEGWNYSWDEDEVEKHYEKV